MKKQLLIISLIASLESIAIQNWDVTLGCDSDKKYSMKLLSGIVEDAKKGSCDALSTLLGNPLLLQCHQSEEFNKEVAKALFVYVNKGDLKSIQHLYKLGINLNIIIEPGDLGEHSDILPEKTSLVGFAVAKKHWHIVKFLLDNGARRLHGFGGYIFDSATGRELNDFDSVVNMLKLAAADNNVKMFRYFLKKYSLYKSKQKYLFIELIKINADKKFSEILDKEAKIITF